MRRPVLVLVVLSLVAAACTGPQDRPEKVHDLRVLGMSFDPPEVLMKSCTPRLFQSVIAANGSDGGITSLDPKALEALGLAASVPITLTTLIADPAGAGRELRYELYACASTGDRLCASETQSVLLRDGATTAGELKIPLSLGTVLFANGDPLLLDVINKDTYKGLGGIRVPVVLKLWATDTNETIYAQKLMVYQCNLFPTMKQNVQPVLPGVSLAGAAWTADEVREIHGGGPFSIEPDDFSALEEAYVVPSLSFKPVDVVESWKIARYTTGGEVSPYETGGADLTGEAVRHHATWKPGAALTTPTELQFWFVVRDGRGGESWLTRRARWTP